MYTLGFWKMEAEFEEYKRYFFLLEVSVELNEVLVWLKR